MIKLSVDNLRNNSLERTRLAKALEDGETVILVFSSHTEAKQSLEYAEEHKCHPMHELARTLDGNELTMKRIDIGSWS